MKIDLKSKWVYRIVHYKNVEHILQNGIYYRGNAGFPGNYVNIGNPEVISKRDTIPVKCPPGGFVNDYVPFYFAIRTPMLYNIHTGYGVDFHHQREIVYLCCNLEEIVSSDLAWCFTDGNAANRITTFYNNTDYLDKLDWRSITTHDFKDDNADGDQDRKRKKHAEFLIKTHLPASFIKRIVVYDQLQADEMSSLVGKLSLNTQIFINPPKPQFYF